MVKIFSIKNFFKSSGAWKNTVFSDINNLHKDIVNFIPNYSNIVTETQDVNVFNKIDPVYPLVLSKDVLNKYNTTEPTAIIPSPFDNKHVSVCKDGKVYENDTLVGDLANLWSTTFNETCDIQYFLNKYYVTSSNQAFVYILDLFGATTRVSGVSSLGASRPRPMCKFQNKLYTTSGVDSSTLGYIDSTNVYANLASIAGYSIRTLINDSDRYIISIASVSQSAQPDATEWVLLWNKGTSSLFEYRAILKGDLVGHCQNDSNIFLFHLDGTDLVCSQLNGFSIVEISRTKGHAQSYSNTSTVGVNYRNRVSYIQGYFVFVTNYNGKRCVFYWNVSTGESFAVYKDNINYPKLVYSYTKSGMHNVLVGKENQTGVLYIPYTTGNGVSDAQYQSNYFTLDSERCTIQRIDIVFDETFPTTSDKISVQLNYFDKLNIVSKQTFEKLNITTNYPDSSVKIDETRLIIQDIGVIGTDFSIKLDVTNSSGAWNLVIRSIDVHYEPVSQQS